MELERADGKDFPAYRLRTLESLSNVERGKFSVRPRNDPRYFGGEIPFIQTGDIVSSGLYLEIFNQTINQEGLKVSRLFPAHTILITIAANIGDTTITKFDVACTDSVVAIQPFSNGADCVWLKFALDTKKDELDSKATQNAQKNINLQVLRPLEFQAPEYEEQTKIANFLTAVDAKISQLTKKHELLTSYKKGVMQKIFSQELRFKDESGEYFPAWKIVRLSEIAEFFRGGQLAKSHLNINGENLCIHYGELFTVYAETISTVKSRTNISDGFIGYAGDIVMPSSDVTPDGLARASCLLIDRVILGGDMNIIRPIKTVDPAMLSYLPPCVRLVVASLDNLGGGNERMTWEDITKQFKVKQ